MDAWTVAGLLALGAWHGVNPGMGWLFAVALGMQEEREGAVWKALPPLALGHALAIAAAVALALAVGRLAPVEVVGWVVAAILVGTGTRKLVRSRHPRYGGMQVGPVQLTVWSFLMATAHGAGLMVVPLALAAAAGPADAPSGPPGDSVPGLPSGPLHGFSHPGDAVDPAAGAALELPGGTAHAGHAAELLEAAGGAGASLEAAFSVTVLHTAAYLAVAGLLAALVYRRLGVRWIRTGWINLDLLWGIALILTGVATPLLV